MRILYLLLSALITLTSTIQAIEFLEKKEFDSQIITSTKRIYLPECPGAWNPSIIKYKDYYLMTFRWAPKRIHEHWISYIGIVLLDDSFEPVTKVQFLDTRAYNNSTPSQSEDARIAEFNGKIYLVYNDNMEIEFPSYWERRDIYIAELIANDYEFTLGEPLKLIHKTKYRERPWQKNWSPFEWNGSLMLTYSIDPHEIINADLSTGICTPVCPAQNISFNTWNSGSLKWEYDGLRGGTPAIIVDGQYLAFFHSGVIASSKTTEFESLWHYYMGAYIFSPEPPFNITMISPSFLDSPEFYTYSPYSKRVIYPGGFVVDGQNIYLAYGKDDSEIWIATINLESLKKSMVKAD